MPSLSAYPASAADEATNGDIVWNNTANITASDDNKVNTNAISAGQTSHNLDVLFSFAVPTGNRIVGIKMEVECICSGSATMKTAKMILLKSGVPYGTDLNDNVTWDFSLDTVLTYGGANNLWGGNWSVADINANLGVRVQAAASVISFGTARIDTILATAYYVPTVRSGGPASKEPVFKKSFYGRPSQRRSHGAKH